MSSVSGEYRALVETFLAGEIDAPKLVEIYLKKFKNETRAIPEQEFKVIDEIFAGIDSYTSDISLIRENPRFYLDEAQLRVKVAEALDRLP
ncbi:colicin immunity domain-containing protein [Mesorhizobium sp. M0904]|uniref:colicin immunity domain-containing protein n=1 Tax=unclassified Mesorhizobium TaxID=325217 RepID=UPI00333563D7